jgi:hypothetical protein
VSGVNGLSSSVSASGCAAACGACAVSASCSGIGAAGAGTVGSMRSAAGAAGRRRPRIGSIRNPATRSNNVRSCTDSAAVGACTGWWPGGSSGISSAGRSIGA